MAIKPKPGKKVLGKVKGSKDIKFLYITAPDLTEKQADELSMNGTLEGKLELIAHNQLVMTKYISDILNLLDKK